MSGTGLRVEIASMRYPNSRQASTLIEDLHLVLPPQKFVSLLGRSGAGKTTLLRMIAGLERRFDGEVILDGSKVDHPSLSLQIVFQDHRLLPWKTVCENVAFATSDPTGDETREQVMTWLKRLGLAHKANEWPKSLSGGEATRVALARALVVQPKVLLLDEPFQALDVLTRFEIQDELIRDLEITKPMVVLVSHSIDDAVFLSDQVYVLTSGPMRVDKAFEISCRRPRARGQKELSAIGDEITRFVTSSALVSS